MLSCYCVAPAGLTASRGPKLKELIEMAEIFIQEWDRKDYDGRRDLGTKSKGKIDGEHAFACRNLTTWFRLGRWIIKHDTANFLLGLIPEMRGENTNSVVYWRWDENSGKFERRNNIDGIVDVVNRHFSGKDYILTLMLLQDELDGYEECLYICKGMRIRFDYVRFIKDKDGYRDALNNLILEKRKGNL